MLIFIQVKRSWNIFEFIIYYCYLRLSFRSFWDTTDYIIRRMPNFRWCTIFYLIFIRICTLIMATIWLIKCFHNLVWRPTSSLHSDWGRKSGFSTWSYFIIRAVFYCSRCTFELIASCFESFLAQWSRHYYSRWLTDWFIAYFYVLVKSHIIGTSTYYCTTPRLFDPHHILISS
jgi:hypothetical protein